MNNIVNEIDLQDAISLAKVYGVTRNEEVLKRYGRQGAYKSASGFFQGRRLPLRIEKSSLDRFLMKKFVISILKNRTKESLKTGYSENYSVDKVVDLVLSELELAELEMENIGAGEVVKSDFNLGVADFEIQKVKKILSGHSEIAELRYKLGYVISENSRFLKAEFAENFTETQVLKFKICGIKREVCGYVELIDFIKEVGGADYDKYDEKYKGEFESGLTEYRSFKQILKLCEKIHIKNQSTRKEIHQVAREVKKKFVRKNPQASSITKILLEEVVIVCLMMMSDEKQLQMYNQIVRMFMHYSLMFDNEFSSKNIISYDVKGRELSLIDSEAIKIRLNQSMTLNEKKSLIHRVVEDISELKFKKVNHNEFVSSNLSSW